jgi:hypothetical protein
MVYTTKWCNEVINAGGQSGQKQLGAVLVGDVRATAPYYNTA